MQVEQWININHASAATATHSFRRRWVPVLKGKKKNRYFYFPAPPAFSSSTDVDCSVVYRYTTITLSLEEINRCEIGEGI